MSFAVAEISRRGADQFSDLVAVLKLGAVDFDHSSRIAGQTFSRRFYQARFAGTGWPQEKKISNGPPGARHPRDISLVNVDDLLDGFILPHNPLSQVALQLLRLQPCLRRIQLLIQPPHTTSRFLTSVCQQAQHTRTYCKRCSNRELGFIQLYARNRSS